MLVIQYIVNVEKSKHIAKKVNLSTLTIDTHRKNIQKKTGLIGAGKLMEYDILDNLRGNNRKYRLIKHFLTQPFLKNCI